MDPGSSTVRRNLSDTIERTAGNIEEDTSSTGHPVLDPFGQISVCRSREDTATTVAVIIADWLEFTDRQKADLVAALQLYFGVAGIENDRLLTAMEDTDWPTDIFKSNMDYPPLTLPVMSCLRRVTNYTSVVMEAGLYVRKNATFADLQTFARRRTNRLVGGAVGSVTEGSSAPSKLPSFEVPRFNEDYKDGQDYLKCIERAFKSNALIKYLTDAEFCESHQAWSSALASRIREALNESSILSFLAAENEEENNCCYMFKALSDHLLTVDLKVAMTFEEWQKFFGLRCDSLDGFLPFYSSVRTSVTRLKEFKSFPRNTGNLLPSEVHAQVQKWFDYMVTPAADRDPAFAENFKFVHKNPKVKVVYKDRQKPQRQGGYKPKSRDSHRDDVERATRRRRRDSPSASRERSRSRSRDSKSSKGVSFARRSRRLSRSRSRDRRQFSSDSSDRSPVSGSRNLLGRTYSDEDTSTDDDDKRKKKRKASRTTVDKSVFNA